MDKVGIYFVKIRQNLKCLWRELNVCRNLTKAQEQRKDVNRYEGNTVPCFRRVLVYSRVFWREAIMEEATVKSGSRSRAPRPRDLAAGHRPSEMASPEPVTAYLRARADTLTGLTHHKLSDFSEKSEKLACYFLWPSDLRDMTRRDPLH